MAQTFGVIGYGSFGKLIVDLLPEDSTKLIVSSKNPSELDLKKNEEVVTINELCERANVIFLCIPISAYESVLSSIAPNLNPNTLIVDVASVKEVPEKLLKKHLPEHKNVLMTHPLFGPETVVNRDLSGFKFIVTSDEVDESAEVLSIFKDLGAEIIHTSAEDHDRQMAYTHSLTFFISQALVDMDIQELELSAPSYKKLLALKELETHHSTDLFDTIQANNPYAKATRQQLIDALVTIDSDIHEDNGHQATK